VRSPAGRLPDADDLARRLPRPGICAAIYGGSILVLLLSHLGSGWGFVDLTIYRYGGQAALHGAHLYALRFPGALAFTYPPFAALLFTGLTVPSMAVLRPLLTAGDLLLLPAMLGFALRLAPVSGWLSRSQALRVALLAAAVAIWLEPVWTTLRYSQIDVLIGALVLYDLSRPDGSRWKGAAIGLAIGLKLTPVIFALYLLLSRRYRAAAVSAAAFCGTIATAFVLLPGDSREYWGGAFIDPGRVGRIENAANQSLRGALARLVHSMDVQTAWLCAAVAVGLAGMAMAVAAARRGDEARGFALCALTGLLVSPVSWSHHWTLAVPALLVFALGAYRRGSIVALWGAAAAAALAFSHVIWWVPVNRPLHSELHLGALQLLYADAYVLAGLCALAAAGAGWLMARRTARPRAAPALLLRRAPGSEGVP
jgi:alpha-1,2-mannosyltransferase